MSTIPKNPLPGSAKRLSGIDFSSNDVPGQSIRGAAATFKHDIAGQQFTFVKASEGTGYKNPYFKSEWKILGKDVKSGAEALRVAYHFLSPGTAANGIAQAKAFLAAVGVKGKLAGGTRLALDWEAGALKTPAVLKGAADYLHKVTGQWPIVYTSSSQMSAAMHAVPHAPRWEANYGPNFKGIANEGGKILPNKKDVFDQYSDGRGYGRPYDMNVYNGSLEDLRKFAGDGAVPAKHAPAKPAHGKPGPALQLGAKGAQVKRLQELLDKAGCNVGGVDGAFGPKTQGALMDYQQSRGLPADGVAGPETWNALLSAKRRVPGGAVGGARQPAGPISARGRQQMRALENAAASYASGRRPLGWCLAKVEDYLDTVAYGKIGHGNVPRFPYAHDFADYLNQGSRYKSLGLRKLDIHNPYDAPAGAIIVVRAGTPGTHNPVAGDIVVKGPGDHFYNDGEMGYGGPGNFPPGNSHVLGIYVPA